MRYDPEVGMDRLLLCSDMDRTIIPNGSQPEHSGARQLFRRLCGLPSVTLAYVTGRHLQLMIEAMDEFELPAPDYAITDVGTRIYCRQGGRWSEMTSWQERIAADWHGKSRTQLQKELAGVSGLILQEADRQNSFKLSYYLPLSAGHEKIVAEVERRLSRFGVDACVIWSVDEQEQRGLLDVLPRNATKLHGIYHLQRHLGYALGEVVFAGDSGNDLDVLGSPIRSILVANADRNVQEQASRLAVRQKNQETLYLADRSGPPLGGNYAAGVVQGVIFFFAEYGQRLE